MSQKAHIPAKYIATRQFGLGGLVTKYDPQDLADTVGKYVSQSPDLKNVIFDNGYVQPRFGSTLVLPIPTGETGAASQTLKVVTSDGLSYMIAIYGVNFYLFEPSTPQWLKITDSVTVTLGKTFRGISWNINISNDVFYMGNGVDTNLKWQTFLSTLSVTTGAADGTVTLTDTSHLPATGSIVIYVAGVPTKFSYTANNTTTGVLTLSGTTGQVFASGSFVSTPLTTISAIPKAKLFARFQGRLAVANSLKNETQLNVSVSGSPENFTTGTTAGAAFTEYISDGSGGITDIVSFGQFILICKEDSLNQLAIAFSADLSSQYITIAPLVSGRSTGPISALLNIQSDNILYYPSTQNGIYELAPSTTGSNASTKIKTISDNIFPTITNPVFSFAKGRSAFFDRKLIWPASTLPNQAANDILLVYDLQRSAWSIWDNWNAVDVIEFQANLYFLSSDDGGLYLYDKSTYSDNRGGIPIPYTSSCYGKRWDFGEHSNIKGGSFVHLTGYIDISTDLFVDVLFETGGSLAIVTYLIDGSNTDYVTQVLSYGIGFKPIGSAPIGGAIPFSIGVFSVYLDIPIGYKWITIQVRPYSIDLGSNWGINGVAVNPDTVETIPPKRKISHI